MKLWDRLKLKSTEIMGKSSSKFVGVSLSRTTKKKGSRGGTRTGENINEERKNAKRK